MSWVGLALLGGVVGLDSTSFPQSMVCRPVVAGALTGLLWGRPVEGVILGLLMEVFSLVILPIGAARYPESGTATVAATGAYLAAGPPVGDPAMLCLALGFGLAWEAVTGLSVISLRRWTGHRIHVVPPTDDRIVERLHLGAMARDLVRGGLVTLVGATLGMVGLRLLAPVWGLPASATLAVITVVAVAMLGTASRLFGATRGARLALVAGLGAGLVAALLAS